jgi:hypothetical protein
MRTAWLLLQPGFVRIALFVFLVASTSLVAMRYEPTSKVSWLQEQGLPFAFLTVSGYAGPCTGNDFCRNLHVDSLDLGILILDAAVWYLVSCAVTWAYAAARNQAG